MTHYSNLIFNFLSFEHTKRHSSFNWYRRCSALARSSTTSFTTKYVPISIEHWTNQSELFFLRSFQFTSYSLSIAKVSLWKHLSADMSEQINRAIKFYQQTSQRHSIYCKQLELSDSSWGMFIQRIALGVDHTNNWKRVLNCISFFSNDFVTLFLYSNLETTKDPRVEINARMVV